MTEVRDENHKDYLGNCEGCGKQLFVGDRGLHYSSSEICCDGPECTGTWGSAAEEWEIPDLKEGEPEGYASFQEALTKHLAAGGSLDDKHTQIL